MDDKALLNLMTDMVRLHSHYVNNNLRSIHLQIGQGAVISTLGEYGEMPQNQIAKIRDVSAATISVMIRRMEASGLIVRKTDKKDAKINIIALTDKGQEAYKLMMQGYEQHPKVIFDGFTEEEKQQAEVIFNKICNNLSGKI